MGKVTRKCCRAKPKRCSHCPVVALRLHTIKSRALRGKELRRAVKAARVH